GDPNSDPSKHLQIAHGFSSALVTIESVQKPERKQKEKIEWKKKRFTGKADAPSSRGSKIFKRRGGGFLHGRSTPRASGARAGGYRRRGWHSCQGLFHRLDLFLDERDFLLVQTVLLV
ncbi:MAG: hypothetical protein LBN38_04385, partial [Verrucomicrobiota bacterium]|nr:hypothetical protein [Verrucomicrobiota bacterium]